MRLLTDYLFVDFIDNFSSYFQFERVGCMHKHAYYTWHDFAYSEYMSDFLQMLAPISHFKKGSRIFSELDAIYEVIFVRKGTIGVGFAINKQETFPITLGNSSIMGAFEV